MRLFPFLCLTASLAGGVELNYAPAPADNPLKGLVPYVGASGKEQFPHSMEFRYFALKDLMTGRGKFDWTPLERTLQEVTGRGNQLVFRVYSEYPGKGIGLPFFLQEEGVKLTTWNSKDEAGGGRVSTPDYRDPKMRSALREFVSALGERYDGDPRVGFITAGLLGLWGEWHDYPREDLWAPEEVQEEVMIAYEKAFRMTPILLRYPAGETAWKKAPNVGRRFGYHDDSFAWATLETGKKQDSWYFLAAMHDAGAGDTWKRHPIGGEIRPELWKRSFTDSPHPRGQDFAECVRQTHVTWLMDSGLFDLRFPLSPDRKARAIEQVLRMGYELHVSKAILQNGELRLLVENRGVAPFYHDWPVNLQVTVPGRETRTITADWKLSEVLPGRTVEWRAKLGTGDEAVVRIGIPNPMKGGKALRFANAERKGDWLVLRLDGTR